MQIILFIKKYKISFIKIKKSYTNIKKIIWTNLKDNYNFILYNILKIKLLIEK